MGTIADAAPMTAARDAVPGASNGSSQPAGAGSRSALAFRPDIEGLRGVAVAIVVLVHAGVSRIGGGYVGVDVFFVISGFLITSLLVAELARDRRISIARFYARRARRILPAACLVIAVTVVAGYVALGALVGRTTALDGRWATAFAANFRFIHLGTDYFASAQAPSLLQHYWSLAVEEQFYLVWPALLLAFATVGRRLRGSMGALQVGVVSVVVGSLLWSVHETRVDPTGAYFSPFTRAWELGIGALVAVVPAFGRRGPAWLRAAVTWVGLGMIAYAAATFSPSTPFPGSVALLPVGGAALVIAGGAGAPRGSAAALLGLRPLRWIGLISFSLYLWHWPVLMVAEQRASAPLSGVARAMCVVVATLLSIVSFHAVERPLRSARWLEVRGHRLREWHGSRRSLGFGAAVLGVAFAVCAVAGNRAVLAINASERVPRHQTSLASRLARQHRAESAAPHGSVTPASSATRVRVSVADQRFLDAQAAAAAAVHAGGALRAVPSGVDPPVLQFGRTNNPYYERCGNAITDSTVHVCSYGDVASHDVLFVLGDSHVGTWLGPLDAYAKAHGLRLDALSKPACALADIANPTYAGNGGVRVPYPQCPPWRAAAIAAAVSARPKLIVVVVTHNASGIAEDPLEAGMRATYRQLRVAGAPVVAIGDNPGLPIDPSLCLSRPGADPRACAGSIDPHSLADDATAARASGVGYVDVEPWLCVSPDRCPVIIDNRIAYANAGHISYQYAMDLEPVLTAALQYVTGTSPSS